MKWDDKKGEKKVERLRKIAKEAAEQCHRSAVPEVETPILSSNCLLLLSTMMCYWLPMKKMQKAD